MSKIKFKGSIPVTDGYIEAELSLLSFTEDNVVIIYSAELDIAGSGYNLNEAKASFWETVSEFFRYTVNKGTLLDEFRRLGWAIKGPKNNRKISSPAFTTMLKENKEFKDIILNKDYTKYREKVQIPQFA